MDDQRNKIQQSGEVFLNEYKPEIIEKMIKYVYKIDYYRCYYI